MKVWQHLEESSSYCQGGVCWLLECDNILKSLQAYHKEDLRGVRRNEKTDTKTEDYQANIKESLLVISCVTHSL